ncbi:hypothetical protein B0H14DRAFT_3485779 [Mycena olivaceomarginata]|nr:hypothetical protein B0H14DRAFT_3485779 [Mycena olivaceomarginata]
MAGNLLTMNDLTAPHRRLPNVKFRVFIAGRANTGKTSILQRIIVLSEEYIRLNPTSERGQYDISDELEFSNHKGYIIQNFVDDRSHRNRLQERLHAIWYCIPVDGNRASLDIEPFHKICPDKNGTLPVIAVFTKFETFMHSTRSDMMLKDQRGNLKDECGKSFKERYSDELGMQESDARCEELIKTTMKILDTATVALMLLAVQTENMGLNVQVPGITETTHPDLGSGASGHMRSNEKGATVAGGLGFYVTRYLHHPSSSRILS